MGLFSFSKFASSDEAEQAQMLDWALKKYKDYKKREAEASEAERKEAEEALSFLKDNDKDPT